MGYYGDFSFSVVIPANKIQGAERALAESSDFGKEFKETFYGDIVSFLKEYWIDLGADEIFFEREVPALTALARAVVDDVDARGALTIEGYTHQKWRSWAEDMFDLLAPFIQADSLVEITGEEGERVRWEFDGKERIEDGAEVLFSDALNPLRDAERALAQIALYIEEHGGFGDIRKIIEGSRPDLLNAEPVNQGEAGPVSA